MNRMNRITVLILAFIISVGAEAQSGHQTSPDRQSGPWFQSDWDRWRRSQISRLEGQRGFLSSPLCATTARSRNCMKAA